MLIFIQMFFMIVIIIHTYIRHTQLIISDKNKTSLFSFHYLCLINMDFLTKKLNLFQHLDMHRLIN